MLDLIPDMDKTSQTIIKRIKKFTQDQICDYGEKCHHADCLLLHPIWATTPGHCMFCTKNKCTIHDRKTPVTFDQIMKKIGHCGQLWSDKFYDKA